MGIFFAPYLFAWYTLKKEYSNIARIMSFSWAFIIVVGMFTSNNEKRVMQVDQVQDIKETKVVAQESPAIEPELKEPHKLNVSRETIAAPFKRIGFEFKKGEPIRNMDNYSSAKGNNFIQTVGPADNISEIIVKFLI